MRTAPIKSLPILNLRDKISNIGSGRLYVGKADLEGAQSYHIEDRRLKLYSDTQSGHVIPQEWREEGVTIEANPTRGGPAGNVPGVMYTIFRGMGNTVLDTR